jgi:hypothetical protein
MNEQEQEPLSDSDLETERMLLQTLLQVTRAILDP